MDCDDALAMARFWAIALGYVEKAPPESWDSWEDWLRNFEVPLDHVMMADPEGNEFCVV